MDTLNKIETEKFFKNQDGFNELERIWKEATKNDEELRPVEHMVYAILRGKDWRKGFTPVTNKNKLANGRTKDDTLRRTLYEVEKGWGLRLFKDILVDDVVEKLKEILPIGNVRSAYRETVNVS